MIQDRPLRIVMITPLLGEAYGQERALCDSTALLRAAGHQVFFVTERQEGLVPANDGSFVIPELFYHHSLSPPGLVRKVIVKAVEFITAVNPDVVHIIDQPGFRVISALQAHFPVVTSSHTVASTCPASSRMIQNSKICEEISGWQCIGLNRQYGCLDLFKDELRRVHSVQNYLLRRRSLMESDVVLAVSRYIQNLLINDGWDKRKVRLVYNPVEIPARPAPLDMVPENLIVCGSRMVQPKGIDFLIRAMKRVEDLRWTLWLCGDGDKRGELFNLVKELGLEKRISFLGTTSYEFTKRIVGSAKLVVQPSIGPEAFGLTVAEACALGKPVVAFNVPAINEIVRHEKNGLLATPADSESLAKQIRRVLVEDGLGERLGARGTELIRDQFSPGQHLRDTLLAYHEAVRRFKTRTGKGMVAADVVPAFLKRKKAWETLRVVMVSPVLGEAFGQERVMRDSGELLRQAGHKVYFLGDERRGRISDNHGVKLIRGMSGLHFLSSPAQVNRTMSEMLKFLDAVDPHVIHLIDQFDHRLMEILCERYPVLLTSHTLATTCPSSCRLIYAGSGVCTQKSGLHCLTLNKKFHCLGDFKNDLRRMHAIQNYLLRRKALRKSQIVVAISKFVEQSLSSDGWPKEKIRLVYNPISIPKHVEPLPGLPSPLLVCASRLVAYKGIQSLIRAMTALRELPWTLWVCGEGPLKKELLQLTQDLGLAGRIHFQGTFPYEHMRRVIASSVALVQPNIGPEPFGLSVAEASAMGVPVVAANVSALNEIIDHDVNGLLYPPSDVEGLSQAIAALLTNPELRRRLAQAGPRVIQSRFSPENHLKETLGVYQECVANFSQTGRLAEPPTFPRAIDRSR